MRFGNKWKKHALLRLSHFIRPPRHFAFFFGMSFYSPSPSLFWLYTCSVQMDCGFIKKVNFQLYTPQNLIWSFHKIHLPGVFCCLGLVTSFMDLRGTVIYREPRLDIPFYRKCSSIKCSANPPMPWLWSEGINLVHFLHCITRNENLAHSEAHRVLACFRAKEGTYFQDVISI